MNDVVESEENGVTLIASCILTDAAAMIERDIETEHSKWAAKMST